MNSIRKQLIRINFSLSIAFLLVSIATLALRVIFNLTGLNLQYFYPYCNLTYLNVKFGTTYLSLLAGFGINAIVIACAGLITGLLFSAFRATCGSESEGEGNNIVEENKGAEVVVRN